MLDQNTVHPRPIVSPLARPASWHWPLHSGHGYGLPLRSNRPRFTSWLEALIFAILLGVAIRSLWTPASRWRAGIEFSAKTLLAIAVGLLGASVGVRAVLAIGPAFIGVSRSFRRGDRGELGISRALGLPQRMAIMVACGNSICGNSAIAAVAPVIGAAGEDVASSTRSRRAGVIVVLVLPLLVPLLQMSLTQYGVMAD